MQAERRCLPTTDPSIAHASRRYSMVKKAPSSVVTNDDANLSLGDDAMTSDSEDWHVVTVPAAGRKRGGREELGVISSEDDRGLSVQRLIKRLRIDTFRKWKSDCGPFRSLFSAKDEDYIIRFFYMGPPQPVAWRDLRDP